MPPRHRLVLLMLSLPVLTGCYVYRPADASALETGNRVRARLSPAEAARLAPFTPEGTRVLDGVVVETASDSVMMSVPVHTELQGNRLRTLEQRIMVDRGGIIDVEARSLDRGRTTLVGVVAAAAVLSVVLLKAEDSGVVGGGNPDPPVEARVSWLRLAIPWF